ncbi:MAG TPA: GtrA family protein [Streptosporangiaceae bacterium]
MISARVLYQRFRLLIHESFKFLIVGGIGMLLTIATAVTLQSLGKYVAITIATIAATIVTFLGNRYWTFRHRQGDGARQESVLFFLLNGVGLVIYYGCIWVIQDLMRLESRFWYTVALVVGTGLGTLFRFWSYRRWVWTIQHKPGPAGPEFPGYPEPALAVGIAAPAIRARSSLAASRPPGHAVARHAASRRGPDLRAPARGRPGNHRRI